MAPVRARTGDRDADTRFTDTEKNRTVSQSDTKPDRVHRHKVRQQTGPGDIRPDIR